MSVTTRFSQLALCAALITSAGPEALHADNTSDILRSDTNNNHLMDPEFADRPSGNDAIKEIRLGSIDTTDTDDPDPDPFTGPDGIYFFHQAMGLAWQRAVRHVNQYSTDDWIEKLDPIILQSSTQLGPFDGMYVPSQGENGKNISLLIINTNNYTQYNPEKYDNPDTAMAELSDILSLELLVNLKTIRDLQDQESQAFGYLVEDYTFQEVEKTPQSQEAVKHILHGSSLRLINFLQQLQNNKESKNSFSPK